MRIWFDTEFYEDGRTIELISIGAVNEDGEAYYAETLDSHWLANETAWLSENVAPRLRAGGWRRSKNIIATDIVAFCGDAPEVWAYYADYDWVALCQLFGRMIDLPDGWPRYCRDLKQLADFCGGVRLPKRNGDEDTHDALGDAFWCKRSHLWLEENHLRDRLPNS